MGFDEQTKKMYLRGCFPGVSCDEVLDNMSFAVDTQRAAAIDPPTEKELHILRDTCDPQRLILGN
jgi:glutaconate CoA-transferase subunit B